MLWLQMTGGEPLIDNGFRNSYALAWDLGMMIQISSNGSRLSDPRVLELLTTRRSYRITLPVYGATEESYDTTTKRRGAFVRFLKGLQAGTEAGLPLELNQAQPLRRRARGRLEELVPRAVCLPPRHRGMPQRPAVAAPWTRA
ncbi:radical SAM protein [Gandjariella thermophila]|uniref:radical SAM protein n=1 Tax=Gandjariella thermophila TaxID=1931992 RepID=UPI00129A2951|nr:hypothetical protein [Gandjariella thermophila]